jgi:hypothetical protein
MIEPATAIEFTDNYEDLSDEDGFRFRFYCERCDNDYTSDLQPCPRAEDAGLLKVVGKIFAEAADNGTELTSDEEQVQHDVALRSATTQVRERFHECPGCGEWVCDVCWNRAMLLCEKCAPSGEEQGGEW